MSAAPDPAAAARRLLMTAIVALDETDGVRPAPADLEAVANADLAELFACGQRIGALEAMRLAAIAVGIASQLTGEFRIQIARWVVEFAEQDLASESPG